ncbi:hypothetical protein DJ031_16945 [bacterium endosymbiont of Escarpia laminata]|nr:MAG: hypothetical protein DJ031_16945 [bacterium endosymbiont of Escarpia laminata]
MTVKDIREWTARDGTPAGQLIPYVDQVRSALGIEQELWEPPIAKELDTGQVDGVCVPAMRFPTWMQCPSCGLLHSKPWREQQAGLKPRCNCEKKPELEQVPWVLVHADGHLADVPWHFLAHKEGKGQKQQQCRAVWEKPYLKLIDQGVSNRRVVCSHCHSRGNFPDSLRIHFGKGWRQPWIPEPPDAPDKETPADLAEVLEINDARVHSPVTCSALVIPPESRIRRGSVVDRLYSSTQTRIQIESARNRLSRKGALQTIAAKFRCLVVDVEDACREIEKGYPLYGKNITQGILLEGEYQALIEEIPDVADDEDFVTEHHTKAWKRMAPELLSDTKPLRIINSIDHLIAVNRIKEIMVLKGFQRLGGDLVPPDIDGSSSWLPALELYGEGVFFTIKEEILSRWESTDSLKERANTVERRFEATGLHFEHEINVSPRFLLLHTLAHLLIRQLEMEAGYPAASLKERIYCSAGKGGIPMSGILIYVAVPDVVGSLGGLAELAIPERFLPLLSGVFDHAEWCSLDPVCSEHEGQGPHLLNRSACHACALVPEPSCAYGNVLLDRIFIKGDEATGTPAFLDFVN